MYSSAITPSVRRWALLAILTSTAAIAQSNENFAPVVTYLANHEIDSGTSILVADVNGDGKPDLLMGSCYGIGPCFSIVSVFLGNGDGTFQTGVDYAAGGTDGAWIAVADVNQDGKADLLVANYLGGVGVLLGNGDGTFQAPVLYSPGGSNGASASSSAPIAIAVQDVNADGKPDLIVTNNCVSSTDCSSGSVGVLLGNGDGTFQTAISYGSGGYNADSLAVSDVNGDGKADLVVANNCASGSDCTATVSVLLGNGDGTFQTAVTYAAGGSYADSVAMADVNGDGKLDLVVASTTGGILLGNGDGTFQAAIGYGTATGFVAVADVNGDGKQDLVVPGSSGYPGNVSVLLGNGDGTFRGEVSYGSGADYPVQVEATDVNGDGLPDILVVNRNGAYDGLGPAVAGVLINLKPTTTTVSSSRNPSGSGQPVTFTAMVQSQGFTGTPGGTATFYDGSANLGQMSLNGSVATLTTSTLSIGTHNISAAYSGDNNFAPSTSLVLGQTVQGAIATFSQSTINFGDQIPGIASAPQSVRLTNTGNVALTLAIGIAGSNGADFTQTNDCATSLAAGGSCSVNVIFTPSSPESESASLIFTDNAGGSPQTVALLGTGFGATVMVSPTSIVFPGQYVGTSSLPETLIVTNAGNTALTITSVTASASDFGALSNCTNPVPPGMNCTIGVFFDPVTSGTRSGTLAIASNAGSPQTVSLGGAGQDFSMAPLGSALASLTPGQTASYAVQVLPVGGFAQTVVLSCSGAPVQSTCTLSPSSVTLKDSNPLPVTVKVTTDSAAANLFILPSGARFALWLGLTGFPGLLLLSSSSRRRRQPYSRILRGSIFFCALAFSAMWSACGGSVGEMAGTPTGSYSLTVTGTFASGATTLDHATKLTLVVQ